MFDVSKRIKYFRTQRGLTVNALANLAGISQSYLRDIELGNKKPTVEYLEYICDALKISLVAFFDEESEGERLKRLIDTLSASQKKALTEFLERMIGGGI